MIPCYRIYSDWLPDRVGEAIASLGEPIGVRVQRRSSTDFSIVFPADSGSEVGAIEVARVADTDDEGQRLRRAVHFSPETRIDFRADVERETLSLVWSTFYELAFELRGWSRVTTYSLDEFAQLPGGILVSDGGGFLVDQDRLDAFVERKP